MSEKICPRLVERNWNMLGCKPSGTPIEENHRLGESGAEGKTLLQIRDATKDL